MVPNRAIKNASRGPALPKIDEKAIQFARAHLMAWTRVAPYVK